MSRLELSMAWRYMRSRRGSRLLSLISVIAVAGVMVGVSALIVIIGVMNGMQRDLRDKILMASPDIRILPYGGDMLMPDWRANLAKVRKDPGVVAAAPFVLLHAIVTPGTRFSTPVAVIGLPQGDSTTEVTKVRETAVAGDFSFGAPDGRNGAVLGERLAQTLGATPGLTSINIITADPSRIDPVTGFPSTSIRPFLVTGLFRTGMYEYDNNFVFISLEAAQELGQLDSLVTGIEVRTPSREEAKAIGNRLQDSLGIGVRTEDWESQNSALFEALKLEKKGMALILTLIILVAAFNIVGTLSMVVTDKTREIGILRAMGMTARSIRRVFFLQGMIIGAAGTLAGAILGLAASFVIDHYGLIKIDSSVYFIDHLPVATELFDVLAIIAASMVITALATLYPSRQAADLFPVEAIRHE
ncbi:MAG TPA: ABC transporter permease [Gemmatimonadaceae bacterium]|nr:ABC transporter permease [Gemmatimonadaceae bacterium]